MSSNTMQLLRTNFFTSSTMKWAYGGWTFFILENVILSENRSFLIDKLGDDGYHYLYGTISTTAVGTILYGYMKKVRDAPPFVSTWNTVGVGRGGMMKVGVPKTSMGLAFLSLSIGLGLASQSLPKFQIPVHYDHDSAATTAHAADGDDSRKRAIQQPRDPKSLSNKTTTDGGETPAGSTEKTGKWKVRCPFDFTDSKSRTGTHTTPLDETINVTDGSHVPIVKGLDRITRHPGLWSLGFISLGHAFLVTSIPQRVWLGMPTLVALLGGAHTDSRHRRGMGGTLPQEMDYVTSNVPFLAMILGRQCGGVAASFRTWVDEEVKWSNVAVSMGIATVWVLTKGRGGGVGMMPR